MKGKNLPRLREKLSESKEPKESVVEFTDVIPKQELPKDVPPEVVLIHMKANLGIQVGMKELEYVMKKYPQYFKEEVEKNEKWLTIPDSVKDAYWKEYGELRQEVYKNAPMSKGLMYYLLNPRELDAYGKAILTCDQTMQQRVKELHEKHYGPYGL
jgi:hypothetical protein